MFIRSQNREDLMQLDDISVCKRGDFPDIRSEFAVVCYRHGTHCVLGEYSTKEKAIKVLDMMQKKYLETTEICQGDYAIRYVPRAIVFQMPQDNEV